MDVKTFAKLVGRTVLKLARKEDGGLRVRVELMGDTVLLEVTETFLACRCAPEVWVVGRRGKVVKRGVVRPRDEVTKERTLYYDSRSAILGRGACALALPDGVASVADTGR